MGVASYGGRGEDKRQGMSQWMGLPTVMNRIGVCCVPRAGNARAH